MIADMNGWNLTLYATLDRPVAQEHAYTLGQAIGGEHLLSVVVHDDRFGIHLSADEQTDPIDGLASALNWMAEQLAKAGYTVTRWEAVEVLSAAELERRASAASMPALVSTKEFAELAGVSTQRIYELETARSKAAAAGETHHFPTPLVPGYWIKAGAQRWAETRKRKPGPAPRAKG